MEEACWLEEEGEGVSREKEGPVRLSLSQWLYRLLPFPPHFPHEYLPSIYGYKVSLVRETPHYELEEQALSQLMLAEHKKAEEEEEEEEESVYRIEETDEESGLLMDSMQSGLAHRKHKEEDEEGM